MKLRVIQWNIKINCKIEIIIQYLKTLLKENTVINLQEVSSNSYKIINEQLSKNNVYSLNYRTPGLYEGKNRKLGVMTIIYGGEIKKSSLLETSVFPERTLISDIKFNNIIIRNFTFHSLTGVDYKKAKSSNFATIASYLAMNKIDLFTGDANEPKVDSVNDELMEFANNRDKGKNANYLFGKGKVHSLVDSYKSFSINNKIKLEDGYTYIAGKNKKRYDFIYGNQEWDIVLSKTNYEESLKASSDHSTVITDYNIKEKNG